MTSLRESFNRLFRPEQPLSPGFYTYTAPQNDPRNYRLHLRIEPDGSGVLIVNAATVLHLNQTAAEYAYYLIQNQPKEEVARKMAARYDVARVQASQDYQDLIDRIQTLINTPDLDPVTFLDMERRAPLTGRISAPYRLDLAITYQLEAGDDPLSAPGERVKQELTHAEWKRIIDRAWEVGIPHLIFTGGEPTLRDDLAELLNQAETHGQVTGLLTNGLRLADRAYLNRLLQTGLDHILVILQPQMDQSWVALKNILDADIFTAVHLTVQPGNLSEIMSLIERLAQMGLPALSLSASDPSLAGDLEAARKKADSVQLELVWNIPVPYSKLNPVAFEASTEQPEGAGRAWLYIEPDGDVLPGQGINQPLGNMLKDPWDNIWK